MQEKKNDRVLSSKNHDLKILIAHLSFLLFPSIPWLFFFSSILYNKFLGYSTRRVSVYLKNQIIHLFTQCVCVCVCTMATPLKKTPAHANKNPFKTAYRHKSTSQLSFFSLLLFLAIFF